jgi:hypothetical protein
LPTDIRASVEALCTDWIGTKHDVIHELDELQESSNIEDRVRRIMSWLGEDMVKLQEQVRRLEALATAEDRYRLAYLLVGNPVETFCEVSLPLASLRIECLKDAD